MNKFDIPELDAFIFNCEPAGAGYPAPLCPSCNEPMLVPGQHQTEEVQCICCLAEDL